MCVAHIKWHTQTLILLENCCHGDNYSYSLKKVDFQFGYLGGSNYTHHLFMISVGPTNQHWNHSYMDSSYGKRPRTV